MTKYSPEIESYGTRRKPGTDHGFLISTLDWQLKLIEENGPGSISGKRGRFRGLGLTCNMCFTDGPPRSSNCHFATQGCPKSVQCETVPPIALACDPACVQDRVRRVPLTVYLIQAEGGCV